MLKVYMSGPINSPVSSGRKAEDHKQAFDDLKVWLKANYGNWETVNPCEIGTTCLDPNCGPFDGHDWNCWLKADLREMLTCDAILMLPEWEQSAGALLERNVALAVGMRQFTAIRTERHGWVVRTA
jgi:hypothetical protein